MLTKFKNCIVDPTELKFVSRHQLVLKDGTTIRQQSVIATVGEFDDVMEAFAGTTFEPSTDPAQLPG